MMPETETVGIVRLQRLRLVLPGLLTLIGIVFLYWVARAADNSVESTFVAQSTWTLATAQAAGGALLLVGLGGAITRPDRMIGLLTTGLALAWLAPEVAGWLGAPLWVRHTALPLGTMFTPLLVVIGLLYLLGKAPARSDRRLVRVSYVSGAAMTMAVGLLYQPFLDLDCWRICSPNPLVLFDNPVVSRSVVDISLWMAIALSSAFLWRALNRRLARSHHQVKAPWYVIGPIGFLALAEIIHASLLLPGLQFPVDPFAQRFMTLFIIRAGLLFAVGFGIAWDLIRDLRIRWSLAGLASDLEAGASGSLASILAQALNDDTVEVAYWIPRLQRHVDADGRTVVPSPAPGRAVTMIESSGTLLGQVIHSSTLAATDLEREIGSAARLAVDNERLRAELLAQASEIRESQGRIVSATDATRRALERDLHDGAQQSLLALSYKLRIARAEARRAGSEDSAAQIEKATEETLATIEAVRKVAHGIFPSILVDAGLIRALESLRERSGIPVDISLPDKRFPELTEMAVYQLIADAIEATTTELVDGVSVSGAESDGWLTVEVTYPNPRVGYALTHAVDRIGALEGSVVFTEAGLRAEIPCE